MSIESRIATMKFDNVQFEKAASVSLATLQRIKEALNFKTVTNSLSGVTSTLSKFGLRNPFAGPQKGLQELQNSSNRFSLTGVEGGITSVSKSFLAMSTVAITALANITNRAVNAGINLAKSLSLDPIMDGFREYETNMNSIQTILANTKDQGSNLRDVNKALNELNHYSDQTIYNFSEMARNIGTFTAAGVDLKTSVGSIKGIANLAAISGSNSQQASTAMYQLSQAIASGRVSLQDWNSVVNAGMGGAIFQKALARTAVAMGTINDTAVKTEGPMKKLTINGASFRESITAKPGEKSWLTSEVLTNTLKQFSGDLSKADLKAQGFNKSQIKAIQQMGKMGVESATQVKTLTQLMGTLRESVGSGWAKTWTILFGNFKEARNLFTGVSNTLGGIISKSANARNKLLQDFKDLGGRDVVIDAIANGFNALLSVVKPIRQAFRDIFPPLTAKTLLEMAKNLRDFTQSLKLSSDTSENVRRSFRGVFAIFSIAISVVKGFLEVFKDLIDSLGAGDGGFLNFTGGIGDFLVAIDDAIKKGKALEGFFSGLSSVLQVPIRLIANLANVFGSMFASFDSGSTNGLSGALDGFNERLSPIIALGKVISEVWDGVANVFSNVANALAPLAAQVGEAFTKVTDAIADSFSGDNFNHILDVINTGLLAGIVLLLKKFVSGDLININLGGGVLDAVSGSFEQLTSTLKSMQSQIQAETMIKIAIAVGVLTASIVALSLIDSKKLTKALAGVAVSFGILQTSIFALSKVVSLFGSLKLPLITGSLVLLAGALALVSVSVKTMSDIDLKDLVKGLSGVAVALALLSAASIPLSKNSAGMVKAGSGLTILAVGLRIMASAVKDFADISWDEMLRGFVGVAAALGTVAAVMRVMPKGMVLQAAALVILGGALKVMASAVGDFANIGVENTVKGLAGLAGALALIAAAMTAMPNLLIQSVAMVALASALQILGSAIAKMGEMSWEQIGKGLATLAGALTILGAALIFMSTTLIGSAALLVAAGALAVLVPVIGTLGGMSWESITRGLVSLAATFALLGAAGLLLAPVTPILLALSAAMLVFGAGVALAGAGALAFSAAFSALVVAGSAGTAVLKGVLDGIVKSIPGAMKAFAQGIVQFAIVIAKSGPAFTKALITVMNSMLNAIIKTTPKIGKAISVLVSTMLDILIKNIPKIISAGLRLILALLNAIDRNVDKIVPIATRIMVKFINQIGSQSPKLVDAGIRAVIKLINGMTNSINSHSGELGAAGGRLGVAIVTGMVRGIAGGIGAVTSAAARLAHSALNAAKNVLGIKSPSKEFKKIGEFVNKGFAEGLVGSLDEVKEALDKLKTMLKNEIDLTASAVESAQARLKRLRKAKHRDRDAIKDAVKALNEAQSLHDRSVAANKVLNKDLNKQKRDLKGLGKDYDDLNTQLETANTNLENAIKTRDDANKSYTEQYSSLPDITKSTRITSYFKKLKDETTRNEEFYNSLAQLRNMGLDNTSYEKLLSEGTDIQPFLDQLIKGGPAVIQQLNNLDANLQRSAASIGKTASTELYQAGVDAAQGIVNGLNSQIKSIENQMEAIAEAMIRKLKRKLKIKSPSREFMEIGRFSNEGLAEGLSAYSNVVEKSAERVGDKALSALKDSMSQISAGVVDNINVNPVLSPVLDLTQVNRDAQKIGDMLQITPIKTQLAYDQASDISKTQQQAKDDANSAPVPGTVQNVEFTQNNYSPESLSDVDIYRQTRNQLSLAKEALKTS